MKRRQFYTTLSTGLTVAIGGCSQIFTGEDRASDVGRNTDGTESTSDEDTDATESTSDEDTDATEDTNGEDTDSDTTEKTITRDFNEETETNELLINSFDIPEEYTFYDEAQSTISELSEDDAEFSFFEENAIVRRHKRQFIDDSDPSTVSFITSTITIHESATNASNYRQQQANSFSSDSGMDTNRETTYRVPTVVGRSEGESSESIVYLGLADNAVYQLLFTNVESDLETGAVFTKMVEKA